MAAKETPAIRALRSAGVAFSVHEYAHDPRAESYALEAAAALALDPAVVFKTLVVDLDGRLAVCLIPSGDQLDTRALGKRAALADAQRAERVTGYVTGGIITAAGLGLVLFGPRGSRPPTAITPRVTSTFAGVSIQSDL